MIRLTRLTGGSWLLVTDKFNGASFDLDALLIAACVGIESILIEGVK